MKKSVMATTLAASLSFATGACGHSPERTPDADLRNAFEVSTQFWAQKGVRLLGKDAVKLVEIRESTDVYSCRYGRDSLKITPSGDLGTYCGRTGAIIIAKQTYDETVRGKLTLSVDPTNFARFIISHELGHDIQAKRTQLDATESIEKELGADCLAGMANPTMKKGEISSILGGMGDQDSTAIDQRHGSEGQRARAFMHGQQAHGDIERCAGSLFTQNQ